MKKVSFDFDDTLSFESVQDYAKKLINEGIEIHITTSRYEDVTKYGFKCDHTDLLKVAKELNIPKERIHFTNFVDKAEFLKDKDFVWHLDDNDQEILMLKHNPGNVKGIYLLNSDYDYKCNELLGLTHLNEE